MTKELADIPRGLRAVYGRRDVDVVLVWQLVPSEF